MTEASPTQPGCGDMERARGSIYDESDPLVDIALDLTREIGKAAVDGKLGASWGIAYKALAAVRAETIEKIFSGNPWAIVTPDREICISPAEAKLVLEYLAALSPQPKPSPEMKEGTE